MEFFPGWKPLLHINVLSTNKYVSPYCGPKCTLAALHAAIWCVTLSTCAAKSSIRLEKRRDRQTDGRTQNHYITLSTGGAKVIVWSLKLYVD